MNNIISLVFCVFYANSCVLADVQKCAPIGLGKVLRDASSQEGLKALSIFSGDLYTEKDQVPQTGLVFVGLWLLNNRNMPRDPCWSFVERWHSKMLRKTSSSKGSWALYIQCSSPKKVLHKTIFYFAIRIKTSCYYHCFCRPNLQRIIKSPMAEASTEDSATEQGKTQLDAPCPASSMAHSLWKQLVPDCIRFSRFQRTGDLKNQVCSYTSLTKDGNYVVKPSPCSAAMLPWPCASAQVPPAEASCKLSHTLGPQTTKSRQVL